MNGNGARRALGAAAALVGALILGCTSGPQPIAFGQDACDYCRMTADDPRYGAELVTAKGRVHRFDSIECLASYWADARASGTPIAGVWVTDFQSPGHLVALDSARFVRARTVHSPMGRNLVAVSLRADAAVVERELGSAPMPWDEVVALLARERLVAGLGHADGTDGGER